MTNRKVIRKFELDKIAGEEGLRFVRRLSLGNRLYSNEDETLKRVYDKYGNVVSTYAPRSSFKSSANFHNPVEVSGANIATPAFRQYQGKNGFSKHLR